MSRPARALPALFTLLALLLAAPAHSELLGDSTGAAAWKLANGLQVRLRYVPGAAGASVSIAYRAGTLHMPAGHAGLAQLLGELQFMSAAGSVPERTREELSALRPAGWDVRCNDHVSVLTEVAARSQLPGVLLQVAARAHGVQVSDSCFRRSLAIVRTSLAREAFGDPDLVLHCRVRDVALGRQDASILDDARGAGLRDIDAAGAVQVLQRLYVPANATLALAGDFGGLDLKPLIEKLFGDIPAGRQDPEAASPRLQPGARVEMAAGITQPVGVVATIAPSLDDTLHASFYLASLMAGSWWHDNAGDPRPPLTSVFHYSVLDEPDLVRFYCQPDAGLRDTTVMLTRWAQSLDALRGQSFTPEVMNQARWGVDWFLGGPISPAVLRLMRRNVAPLSELSASMATRASWRGDEFWDTWRDRFETTQFYPQAFLDYMLAPGNHAAVLLMPRR